LGAGDECDARSADDFHGRIHRLESGVRSLGARLKWHMRNVRGGWLTTPVRNLQSIPPIAGRPLDLAKGQLNVRGDEDSALPDLQPADSRLVRRQDDARIQNATGIETVLHQTEEGDDLPAEDPFQQVGPKPSVAVLTGRRASQLDHALGHLLQQPGDGASHPARWMSGRRFTWMWPSPACPNMTTGISRAVDA